MDIKTLPELYDELKTLGLIGSGALIGAYILISFLTWHFKSSVSEKAKELVKKEFREAFMEYSFKFEQFHEKKIQSIEEIYSKLIDLSRLTKALKENLSNNEHEQFRLDLQKAFDLGNDIHYLVEIKSIWLGEDLEKKLIDYIKKLANIIKEIPGLDGLSFFSFWEKEDGIKEEIEPVINEGLDIIKKILRGQLVAAN